jgi:hypothetical protein
VQFQPDEPDTFRDVHHVTQLTLLKSQQIYITQAAAKAKQALRKNNQDSSSHGDFTGPQIKNKQLPPIKLLKKTIPKPLRNQSLIPPSINMF